MSLKSKFQNWFYLEVDEEDEQQEPSREEKPRRQQVAVTEQPAQPAQPAQPQQQPRRKKQPRPQAVQEEPSTARVVSLQSAQKSSKMVLVEPRVYAEAQDISEQLKNKRAVVVNLQRIDRDQGIRIIDFLSGTVYALGGDIQRIGTDIFLCVPENVEVAGAISDYFDQ